jgi:hypothetical protein
MRIPIVLAPAMMVSFALAGDRSTEDPIVEEVEWRPFREQCRHLLAALDKDDSPLPVASRRQLRALLDRDADDKTAARDVQKLLDPHCLLLVGINAESRVHVSRGPASVRLRRNRETIVLLKIDNKGGVTHALRLHGPELIGAGSRGGGRWLEARLVTERPFAAALSGRQLEYRLLRLTPRQAGKREATFQVDAGQGTEDLGFRAETPILFTIDAAD